MRAHVCEYTGGAEEQGREIERGGTKTKRKREQQQQRDPVGKNISIPLIEACI